MGNGSIPSLEQEIRLYFSQRLILFDDHSYTLDNLNLGFVNLRDSTVCYEPEAAFAATDEYLDGHRDIFHRTVECYGAFRNGRVGQEGIELQPAHWTKDYQQTR